jgi:hypothetical protein
MRRRRAPKTSAEDERRKFGTNAKSSFFALRLARVRRRRLHDPAVRMATHLQRGADVRGLYRKGLELSRQFPDPCARNYLMRRVQEVFRKRARETSPTKIGQHIKEGRQSVRRMERALHGKDDYERITKLAYGVVGRVKHLLDAANAECIIGVPRNQNRPPRFSLPPMPGEAGETFTLGLLLRKIEHLTSGDAGESTRARPRDRESQPGDLELVRRQLETLWDTVPPPRSALSRGFAGEGGAGTPSEEAILSEEEAKEKDAHGASEPVGLVRKTEPKTYRFRAGWLPGFWDVDRLVSVGDAKSRPATHWRGFSGDANDWEITHVALVLTTFRPIIERLVQGESAPRSPLDFGSIVRGDGEKKTQNVSPADVSAARLRRSWRRFYGTALGVTRVEALVVRGVPPEWTAQVGKQSKSTETARPGDLRVQRRVQLAYRGRIVDAFEP